MSDGTPLEDDIVPIWNYIAAFQAKNGYAPTLREIADGLGLHFSRVNRVVTLMVEAGYIGRPERRARALSLLNEPPEVSSASSA